MKFTSAVHCDKNIFLVYMYIYVRKYDLFMLLFFLGETYFWYRADLFDTGPLNCGSTFIELRLGFSEARLTCNVATATYDEGD